jgi:formylglycine-generating enzyme required for sulfatase activity
MGTSAEELRRFRALFPNVGTRALEGDLPERVVTVPPFAIDKFEVTNEAFARFVAANPQWSRQQPIGEARHPVVNVTWQAAGAYCRWRGGRLPTEAEWEYAARGGREGRLFPWGDDPPDPSRANYAASGIGAAMRGGSYPPNGYGLFDMSGNVWEWVADAWTTSDNSSTRRVIRGGSWGGVPVNLRVAHRDSHPAGDARDFVGFRCAYDAHPVPPASR